jgi:threonine synthase
MTDKRTPVLHHWTGLINEYRDWMPFAADWAPVTLNEGGTPLIRANHISEITGCDVWLKVEGANPTGSFKDRGMTVAVTDAVHAGKKVLMCASTGNTSASAAAYAARAGHRLRRADPRGQDRPGQALPGGHARRPKIIQVRGNFDDCLELVRKTTTDFPEIALVNSVNPMRIEGQKTAAFEIVDALGDAPDIHALPVGNAGNITAYWKGYSEYAEAGLSSRRDR